ncbi:MAG: FHA domain-containing protein [Deltaproteobacteria bacterium]|nr:FHA domain-containing protein [Deltaproteobacteria bacterium]
METLIDARDTILRVRVMSLRDNSSTDYEFGCIPIGIGRDPSNKLQVDDPFVSRFHAAIESTRSGLVLTDLGSINGTFVHGRRIAAHSPVILGLSQFTFSLGGRMLVGCHFARHRGVGGFVRDADPEEGATKQLSQVVQSGLVRACRLLDAPSMPPPRSPERQPRRTLQR